MTTVVYSKGLAKVYTQLKLKSLYDLLHASFPTSDTNFIMNSMHTMEQYFIIKNRRIVACASIADRGELPCVKTKYSNVLYNVATSPLYRNKGFMNSILSAITQHYKKKRKKYIYLAVAQNNKPAIALYKKFGFRIHIDCNPLYDSPVYIMRIKLQTLKF